MRGLAREISWPPHCQLSKLSRNIRAPFLRGMPQGGFHTINDCSAFGYGTPNKQAPCRLDGLEVEGFRDVTGADEVGGTVLRGGLEVADHQVVALEVLDKSGRRIHHERCASYNEQVA